MAFFYAFRTAVVKKTVLLVLLIGSFFSAVAQTIYVKPTGNDASAGTSWATAYKTVSKALGVATAGKAIWVAAGVYTPTATSDRTIYFTLKNGVTLYGGFAGTETLLSQRSYNANLTILSGDIGAPGNAMDNTHHVVYSAPGTDNTAIIDGFRITAGYCEEGDGVGGGMFNNGGNSFGNCTPVIRNCTFTSNYAPFGGGAMANVGRDLGNSNPTVINCIFSSNTALFGGAIYNESSNSIATNPTFTHCVFEQNTSNVSSGFAGAVYNTALNSASCNPKFIGCIFNANNSGTGGQGGAVLNSAAYGGNNSVCSPEYYDCTFMNNAAGSSGSAILNFNSGGTVNVIVSRCIFWNTLTTTPPVENTGGANCSVTNSDIKGGYTGTGNMNIDPSFANETNSIGADNIWGTADDGFRLKACSPLINLGGNNVAATDFAGQPRVFNVSQDMGAYELQQLPDGTGLSLPGAAGTHTLYAGTNGLITPSCRIFCRIQPNGASPVSGNINIKLTLDAGVQTYNGKPYVTRHYDITPVTNPATATGRITLFFTQADFNTYNAFAGVTLKLPTGPADAAGISHLFITQFHGTSASSLPGTYSGTPQFIDPADADIVWNAIASRWEVSFNVTGFSGFFVHTSAAALPLTLIRFAGTRINGYNLLQWTTASESNTSDFEIQRSDNGTDFSTVGTMPAAGNSSSELQYQYSDKSVQTIAVPFVWYRLKMIDKNGQYTYSNMVKISSNANGELTVTVAPNPFRQHIFVELVSPQQEEAELMLTDISGKIMVNQKALLVKGDNQLQLIGENLYSHNVYILRVTTKNSTRIMRLLKE